VAWSLSDIERDWDRVKVAIKGAYAETRSEIFPDLAKQIEIPQRVLDTRKGGGVAGVLSNGLSSLNSFLGLADGENDDSTPALEAKLAALKARQVASESSATTTGEATRANKELYVRELGNDQYLSKYDTGTLAKRLGNTPEADGDGQKYRGRGLIQITGRANYEAGSEALFNDARSLNTPELLETPVYAAMSAGWFWKRAGLNTLADKGDLLTITKRINGGTKGLADRQALYKRALRVLP